jgi:hypothetical protein
MTQRAQVIDVDRYKDFAVVLWVFSRRGFTPSRRDVFVYERSRFSRRRLGWNCLGGGGSGGGAHLFTQRERWPFRDDQKLLLTGSGGGSGALTGTVACAPDVARVEVRRKTKTRKAEVQRGPGLLAIVWQKEEPPELVAFDREDAHIFTLIPEHRFPNRN